MSPRSAAKIALLGVGGLLALFALLLALGWSVAQTGWGKDRLGKLVSAKATGALAGTLTVQEVHASGLLKVCLKKVSLADPEGVVVLTADEACVSLDALALTRKEARIRSVRLTRPALDVASVAGADGKPTTTLARAIAARNPPPKTSSGPTAWSVEIDSLTLLEGSVKLRPGVGEAPTFALEQLKLEGGKARYSASGALARIGLSGRLTAPGGLPDAAPAVELDLDAQLEGSLSLGAVVLRDLRASLGKSRIVASGSFDLAAKKGAVELRELVLEADDVNALLPRKAASGEGTGAARPLLVGEVRGHGEATLDDDRARLTLALAAGSGTLEVEAQTHLSDQHWSVNATARGIDPGAVISTAPRGKVSLELEASGKGAPQFDAEGVSGELHGKLHIGPAHLDPMGPLLLDLDADLKDRTALVHAFTASALGLKLRMRGAASRENLALDLDIDAPHLEQVSRALATLAKKKKVTLIRGEAQLTAHLSGTVKSPNARLSLRAPRSRSAAACTRPRLPWTGRCTASSPRRTAFSPSPRTTCAWGRSIWARRGSR